MDVGTTLKQFRKWMRMSIRDLGSKANCSIALISKVEQNQTSPTLRTLEKLCAALEVTLYDFLRPPAYLDSEVHKIGVSRQECPVVMTWSGIRLLQIVPKSGMTFTGLIFEIQPGAQTTMRRSLFSHIEICFVLKGTMQLEIDDTLHLVSATEGIYFNTAVGHQWTNVGETPAEVLIYNPYAFTLFEQKEENLRWNLHVKKEKKKGKQNIKASRPKT